MHISKSLGFATLLSLSIEAFAQVPIYAIYGVERPGERGMVKTLNVGTLPSGVISDCQNQIDVFEASVRRVSQNGTIKLIPSSCMYMLPPDLQPMIRGEKLPDAYVLKQSGNWAPIYTAWYGLPINKPAELCAQLIAGMRKKLTTDKAEIECFTPSDTRTMKQ